MIATSSATSGDSGPVSVEDIKTVFSGVRGESAKLVTLEPVKTKKLRYTFNHDFREKRIATGLEDMTDDEDSEEELYIPTGAETAGTGIIIEDKRDPNHIVLGDDDQVIEGAAMTKAPTKPVGKQEMSSLYYEWQKKDLAQPNNPGFYDVSGGRNKRRKKSYLNKKKGKKATDSSSDMDL